MQVLVGEGGCSYGDQNGDEQGQAGVGEFEDEHDRGEWCALGGGEDGGGTDEGVGAQRCAGPQAAPQATGGGAEQGTGGECGGEQSAGGSAAQAQGGGQGFQQDQGGEQRQAQCAVEGELGGAFAVAEELGEGDGQGADRRGQNGGG